MHGQVFFKEIKTEIIKNLIAAKKEIKVAVAWLTDEDIIRTLTQKSQDGIEVKVVISDSKENFQNLSKLKKFIKNNGKLFVTTQNFLHHKFCIIDGSSIINGSYNWTYYARRNEENIIIMKLGNDHSDDMLLKQFNVKHDFYCNKYSTFIENNEILVSFQKRNKDAIVDLSKLDEDEILLRRELEDAVRNSVDEAIRNKIAISPAILERMEIDGGSVEFIKRLLHDEISSGEMKSGFRKLEEQIPHRVDLSFEYLVSRPKFHSLFTDTEINFCKGLMKKYGL